VPFFIAPLIKISIDFKNEILFGLVLVLVLKPPRTCIEKAAMLAPNDAMFLSYSGIKNHFRLTPRTQDARDLVGHGKASD
jgi:hypothetical protein